MTIKTRLILLAVCIVLFSFTAPYLVIHSMGYRIDFDGRTIKKTGGIYVKAVPLGATIAIDSIPSKKTNIFLSAIFVQNLLPKTHSVRIAKDGYHSYQKALPVVGNQVTKIEEVILFKKELRFDLLGKNAEWFALSPNGEKVFLANTSTGPGLLKADVIDAEGGQKISLAIPTGGTVKEALWSNDSSKIIVRVDSASYLINLSEKEPTAVILPFLSNARQISFDNAGKIVYLKNKNIYTQGQTVPALYNARAYSISNQTIIWLAADGFVYSSESFALPHQKLTERPFPLKAASRYSIDSKGENIFLQEDDSLYLLDNQTKSFGRISQGVSLWKASPDGLQMLYVLANELWHIDLSSKTLAKTLLQKAPQNIGNAWWLNNHYIIFQPGDGIYITETDSRGSANMIALQKSIALDDGNIEIKKPHVSFNNRNEKVYILTQKTLLSSEKLTP